MIIFFVVAFLSTLNLFNCAELAPAKNSGPLKLDGLPNDMLNEIGYFLDLDFWRLASLNRNLYGAFSNFPIKTLFEKHFNIPELLRDDVAKNEKELKYLLYLFKCAGSKNLLAAIQYELLDGNMINTLIPHLSNYYRNRFGIKGNVFGGEAFIKCKQFDALFQHDGISFDRIFSNSERIRDLQ